MTLHSSYQTLPGWRWIFNDSTSPGVDRSTLDQSGFSLVQSKTILDWDRTSQQFCWTRTALQCTGVDQSSAVSRVRVYFLLYWTFIGRNVSWWYQIYRQNCHKFAKSGCSEVSSYQMWGWVRFSVILDWNNVEFASVCILVQTETVQSKTRSLWSSQVQRSICTALDWALPQTETAQTAGIIMNIYVGRDVIRWSQSESTCETIGQDVVVRQSAPANNEFSYCNDPVVDTANTYNGLSMKR